jgi:hypothetical protein
MGSAPCRRRSDRSDDGDHDHDGGERNDDHDHDGGEWIAMKGRHMKQCDEYFEMLRLLYLTPRRIELMMDDETSRLQTKFSSACEILEVLFVATCQAHS